MDISVGLGAIAALSALWILIRIERRPPSPYLPPPDASCERKSRVECVL